MLAAVVAVAIITALLVERVAAVLALLAPQCLQPEPQILAEAAAAAVRHITPTAVPLAGLALSSFLCLQPTILAL